MIEFKADAVKRESHLVRVAFFIMEGFVYYRGFCLLRRVLFIMEGAFITGGFVYYGGSFITEGCRF